MPTAPPAATAPIEPGEDPVPMPPGASGLVVTKARWDSEDNVLSVEGAVSDLTATLRVDFGGRSENVANDAGRFRGDFVGVVVYPPTVTVTASSGATATSSVEAK
jgi:hypothetical protein